MTTEKRFRVWFTALLIFVPFVVFAISKIIAIDKWNAGNNSGILLIWVLSVFVAAIAITFALVCWVSRSRAACIKSDAKEIAKHEWHVRGAAIFGDKTLRKLDADGWHDIEQHSKNSHKAALELCTVDSTGSRRQELVITMRPNHPDIEGIGGLHTFDVVRFKFLSHPLGCCSDTEYAAYLILDAPIK